MNRVSTGIAAAILAAGALAAEPPRTARGTTGAIEVASAVPLRAKALRDASAPILVRVNAAGEGRYRIEYIGTIEGRFDLAEAIEQADGRAAEGLPDLAVEIYTQLPPNHGTDVFGLGAPGFSLAAHYSTALVAVAALWIAVPVVFLVRRALRPKPAPPPAPTPAPTVAERLLAIVDDARGRELDARERGRLELLLLQELRAGAAQTDAPSIADLAGAVAALRLDARTTGVVRAVERWLHAPSAGDRAAALAEIDRLRLAKGGAA